MHSEDLRLSRAGAAGPDRACAVAFLVVFGISPVAALRYLDHRSLQKRVYNNVTLNKLYDLKTADLQTDNRLHPIFCLKTE